MTKRYLRPIGDDTQYSDAADYPTMPPVRDGFEWVEGTPPENAIPYRVPTLAQQLDALFSAQPTAVKAQFYTLKAAIKLALEVVPPDLETAKLMIENTEVPEELEAIKDGLLALFPETDP